MHQLKLTTSGLGAKPYLRDSINPWMILFDHLEYKNNKNTDCGLLGYGNTLSGRW